jgi:peptidoglycan/LPS O-acetylase OafA/YrhL
MTNSDLGARDLASSEHLLWLDSLRALAIIGVIAVHSFQESPPSMLHTFAMRGNYGVQLFFLVSAFTLTKLYSVKLNSTTQLLDFALRRFFRIWPMYFLGVLIYGAPYSWHDWILNALLLHGFSASAFTNVVPGGWSIALECQFYMIFPLMLIAFRKVGPALVFFGLSMLLASYSFYGYTDPLLARFFHLSPEVAKEMGANSTIWLPRNIVFFAGGALLSRLFDSGMLSGLDADSKRAIGRTGWITLVAICWLCVPEMHPDPIVPFYRHALVCLFFMLLFVYVSVSQPRLLVNPLVCRLGVLSYGIYILHFTGLRLARYLVRSDPSSFWFSPLIFVFTLLTTWAAAEVTWRLVEKPGIKIGRKLSSALRSRLVTKLT